VSVDIPQVDYAKTPGEVFVYWK